MNKSTDPFAVQGDQHVDHPPKGKQQQTDEHIALEPDALPGPNIGPDLDEFCQEISMPTLKKWTNFSGANYAQSGLFKLRKFYGVKNSLLNFVEPCMWENFPDLKCFSRKIVLGNLPKNAGKIM